MDRVAHVADMIRDMAAGLELPLRTIEAEWGPGQFEVTFNPLSGLAAADSLLLFRSAVKHLMRRHGLLASFMAKPALPNVYSSGWHLHQSLRNRETGANAFIGNENLLSDTGYHYIGGLLEHGAALTAFSNPTINGYKRLNANPLAPNRILWAHDNRGAMLRLVGGMPNRGRGLRTGRGSLRQILTCTWRRRFMRGWMGFGTGRTRASRCRMILTGRLTGRLCRDR